MTTDLRTEGLARLEKCREFRKRGFPLDTAAPLMLGEAAAVADELERLTLALESSGLKRLQADIERDCAVEKLAELRKLLTDCADPVSCQLAEARRNLELYKGYSSRERRYQIEIEWLERLMKAIAQPPDVPAEGK